MKNLKTKLSIFCLIGLFTFTGCSSDKSSSSGNPVPTAPAQNPSKPNTPADNSKEINFQNFGMIREFGGTDNAALFGLLSESGEFKISKIKGPGFLKSSRVGKLTKSSIEKLFLNSARPLSLPERQELLSKFYGASVIYLEGYSGQLCTKNEVTYHIVATGTLNNRNVEVSFQFEALPNLEGNCSFHTFGIVVRY